jgi:hypothetical protein
MHSCCFDKRSGASTRLLMVAARTEVTSEQDLQIFAVCAGDAEWLGAFQYGAMVAIEGPRAGAIPLLEIGGLLLGCGGLVAGKTAQAEDFD